ncbi:MAG: regA [Verrucomicrobia bacterium]|nr:regA [Verrucomicrobiota bacterium]
MAKHILIVDDEAEIREVLGHALGYEGYRVSDVASALEAERLIATDPPQLIISDLQLEDSDGLDMIRTLKAKYPDTPMMLLTGVYIDPQVVRDSLSPNVASYLQKTVPLAEILAEVRRLVGK